MAEKNTLYYKSNDRVYSSCYDPEEDGDYDKTLYYLGYRYPSIVHPEGTVDVTDIINNERLSGYPYVDPDFQRAYLDNDYRVHFHASKAHLNQGRVTTMKLGKFLSSFLKWPDQQVIKNVTDLFKPMDIKLANGAEEIRSVYDRSEKHCDSCMSGKFEGWRNHPVEAYDTPSFSLYYTEDEFGDVTNRVLIGHKNGKNYYIRHYGNAGTIFRFNLEKLIKLEEYCDESNIAGLELKPIIHDRKRGLILMPYLDTVRSACQGEDGRIWTGTTPGNSCSRVNSWTYTQEGIVTASFEVCQATGRRELVHNLQSMLHPSTGSRAYFTKGVVKCDPWGYADMRSSHPQCYRNGLPNHLVSYGAYCPITNRMISKINTVEEVPGVFIHVTTVMKHFQRNYLTGELLHNSRCVVDTEGRAFRLKDVMKLPADNLADIPDDMIKIDVDSDEFHYYIQDQFVTGLAKSVTPSNALVPYYKLSELLKAKTNGSRMFWDIFRRGLLKSENTYNLINEGEGTPLYSSVSDYYTGGYYMMSEFRRDNINHEDIDFAAWGVDPDNASTNAMRQAAIECLRNSGISLEDLGIEVEDEVSESSSAEPVAA